LGQIIYMMCHPKRGLSDRVAVEKECPDCNEWISSQGFITHLKKIHGFDDEEQIGHIAETAPQRKVGGEAGAPSPSVTPDPPPPPAPFNVQQDHLTKKRDLELAFKGFHQLVQDKVLNINKSTAVKKTELQTIDQLVRSAQALDNINVGEGILALASIAIREQLIIRDRVNELEYELCKALRDINQLKQKLGVDDVKTKK